MTIPEEQVRDVFRDLKKRSQYDVLIAVIQDEAFVIQKRINQKIQRGKALTPDDWPQMQLDQGRIQALRDLVDRLDHYVAEPEAPRIRAVE